MKQQVIALKSLGSVLELKALVIAALAVGATIACQQFNIRANLPLTLIGTAVIFPIVFSIGGAYKRRERALSEYGVLKAHGRAIYFATRDWIEDTDDALLSDAASELQALLVACRDLFMTPVCDMDRPEQEVYRAFSRLSTFIKTLRARGMTSGEVSRCNQFLSKMVVAFENVKHIYQYRTPRTLRAYSAFFIIALPVLYGPYFAHIGQEMAYGTQFIMPVLFAIVLVSLENIQEHLENPFDQIGADDIAINAEKFVQRLELT